MTSPDRWQVPEGAAGERLDRYLAGRYGIARNRALHWIRAGAVRVDGDPAKASRRLVAGETIVCEPLPLQQAGDVEPEAGKLVVLFEDRDVVVVDKPAGLVVHPGAGRAAGTLAHRLLHHYPETAEVGGPGRPGIVHRLDRDTTGLLVVARTPAAYASLSRAFAERRVEKRYLGIVYGRPAAAAGTLEQPIGRHPVHRKQMTVSPRGRPARTEYRTVAAAAGIALLALAIHTGRTHQIRVHLKALRCPLVGDPLYGEARWKGFPHPPRATLESFGRPALHAWRLGFPHPEDGRTVRCEAPVPSDLEQLWLGVTGGDWPELPPAEPA